MNSDTTRIYKDLFCVKCNANKLHYFVSPYRTTFKKPGWYCSSCEAFKPLEEELLLAKKY